MKCEIMILRLKQDEVPKDIADKILEELIAVLYGYNWFTEKKMTKSDPVAVLHAEARLTLRTI